MNSILASLEETKKNYLPESKKFGNGKIESNIKKISNEELKKILVVDAAKEVREVCKKILERYGYVVTAVSGWEEAIEEIKRNKYDGILLDILMPGGMGEREVQMYVKSNFPELRDKIIYMAGGIVKAETEEFLKDKEFVSKPFNVDELITNIQNILVSADEKVTAP